MIKFIFLLLLGYLGYRIVRGKAAGAINGATTEDTGVDTYQDPVCGTYVAEEDAAIGRLNGRKIYFCSHTCLEKYQEQLKSTSN